MIAGLPLAPRLLRYVLLPLALAAGTGIPSDPAQAQPVRADQPDMAVDAATRNQVIEGAIAELDQPAARPS